MKSFLWVLFLLALPLFSLAQSEALEFKEYSYSELFQMIEQEEDSVFNLNDAIISYDPRKDSAFSLIRSIAETRLFYELKRKDSILVNQSIVLDNVHFYRGSTFLNAGILNHILFKEEVRLTGSSNANFTNCTFNKGITIGQSSRVPNAYAQGFTFLKEKKKYSSTPSIEIDSSLIHDHLRSWLSSDNVKNSLILTSSTIHTSAEMTQNIIQLGGGWNLNIRDNKFIGKNHIQLRFIRSSNLFIANNLFETSLEIRFLEQNGFQRLAIRDNQFEQPVLWDVDILEPTAEVEWQSLEQKLIASSGYNLFIDSLRSLGTINFREFFYPDFLLAYRSGFRIKNKKAFKHEMSLRGQLQGLYKNQHDLESANESFIELKNLETERLSFIYKQSPSFYPYFKWKVNQFLKIFSSYGTDPAKSVVYSVYVILIFAFVYLFFSNSWDEKGRHRLMNRFKFYNKYLRAPNGMHELYLKEKESELSNFEQFKEELNKSSLELPKFFVRWAKPVYHLSMINTRLSSGLLKSTDILSGKWADLPPAKRRWKNIQIGTFLIFGLLWDLLVRVLNALMLSINTFTTLGFGEIPIKGIPRYLAIIQGFIGWFMLTIFSVSLISQLLS